MGVLGSMPQETVRFEGAGGQILTGTLELPSGETRGAAVFAHCFTCTRQSRAAVAVSRELAERGIACLRFDFSGLGDSGGDFGMDSLPADVADVRSAVRWQATRFGPGLLLVGHSLGGAAVLAAAGELPEVAAVATIGAPAEPSHVERQILGDLDAIMREGAGPVTIAGRHFTITRRFLEGLRDTDLAADVGALRRPLMILHSPTDELVGINNAARLFAEAKHPKSFVSLAGADHLLLKEEDADFAAAVIGAWAGRYIARAVAGGG
jgi:pimeloyl-ACP methyl ester carboxylesterase